MDGGVASVAPFISEELLAVYRCWWRKSLSLCGDGCREDVHAPGNDHTSMCIYAALTGLTGLWITKSKQKEAMKLGGRGNKKGLL